MRGILANLLVSVLSTERDSGAHWFLCRTSDAAHCSRKSEGKVRPEAERAEMLERVRRAKVSSSTTSIGTTLGGDVATFGAISFSVLGVGPCQEPVAKQDLAENVGGRLEWEKYLCFRGVYHHGLNRQVPRDLQQGLGERGI